MVQLTRRSFLAGAAAAATAGLVACESNAGSSEAEALPQPSDYPIDPDSNDVEPLFTTADHRSWTGYSNPDGTEIGVADAARMIQVSGLAFRDMNGNGKLDLWEDWRQDIDTRAAALAAELPAEVCLGLMWHGGTTHMPLPSDPEGTDTSENGLIAQGSRAGVSRLSSTIESYGTDIAWINRIQSMCEQADWGIPYLNSTDPYQLFGIPEDVSLAAAMDKDIWRKAGMWLGRAWRATGVRTLLGPQIDVYSQPTGCRLSGSVSEDPALNRDFTQAFAGGLQSTWGDDEATDDQGWGRDSVAAMLKHYAGEGSVEGGRNDHQDTGRYNVYPGDNFNAHLIPFLDGGLHLDSKTEQMASVMPCYGITYNEDEKYGENVGGGYSKHNLNILRNAGWDGMLCTDWCILWSMTYGVGDLTEPERWAKMMLAGEDQCGGDFKWDVCTEAYELMKDELGEDGALERVRESARRIAKVMLKVQLFDQPYSDIDTARAILESSAAADFGELASERSIIMLKNSGGALTADGLGSASKVYLPMRQAQAGAGADEETPVEYATTLDEGIFSERFDIVTDTVEGETLTPLGADGLTDVEWCVARIRNPQDPYDGQTGSGMKGMGTVDPDPADAVYYPITLQYRTYTADGPSVRRESIGHFDEDGTYHNRSYFGQSVTATNESDLDFIIDLRQRIPETAKLVVIVEADRPMVFSELEPYADVILLAFRGSQPIRDEAWSKVLAGEVEPSGLLPFQMPSSMDTVEAQFEDVPRDMDCYVDADGNVYDFCFGLNWSGVIDDERTATYKATPLTEPETEVIPG